MSTLTPAPLTLARSVTYSRTQRFRIMFSQAIISVVVGNRTGSGFRTQYLMTIVRQSQFRGTFWGKLRVALPCSAD